MLMRNLTRLLCVLGIMVSVALAEALDETRKKAEKGDARAQFSLGVMYSKGEGVPKDSAEAVKWYRLAAEQGEPIAEFALGVMYANGRGLPKNETEAVKWYRKAAERRLSLAQMELGDVYVAGKGVAPDFIEAHAWFNIAGASGHPLANLRLNIVQEYMTPLAIAEATDLAKERLKLIKLRPQPWLPKLDGDLVKPAEDIVSSPPDKPVKDAPEPRSQITQTVKAKPPTTKVAKIDAEGIAKGVIGGPTANKDGGAGGKGLVARDGRARPAIFADNRFGTMNIQPTAADAKWSNYGVYLQRMLETVQIQWDRILLSSTLYPPSGTTVTVKFRMNSDGKIAAIIDVKNTPNEQGKEACISAITARSPYGKWSDDMIAVLGDSQEMTFTFYYQ